MALFSKPPAKKPAAPPSARVVTPARNVAQSAGRKGPGQRPAEPQAVNTLTGASMIDWTHAYASIEVAETNPGLCSVLENAALLYAAGQPDLALGQLTDGVQNDHDAKTSPLAWLALFDLLQRADLRADFDQFALQYVVQFERSAPGWEESTAAPVADGAAGAGGYVALSGKLSGAAATQLAGLKRAVEKKVAGARLDLSSVLGFDDAGAHALADLLGVARRNRQTIAIERAEKLVAAIDATVKKGKEGGQGAWLLSLELLQWHHDHATFDDRAVDFAVTFEVSPPSWEPPPVVPAKVDKAPAPAAHVRPGADAEAIAFVGVLVGSNVPQIAAFSDFAHRHSIVAVDMAAVDRMDFVCAGAFLNAIGRVEGQRKTVQIFGASPIVRALLLLIGVSPRHFVKKAA
jgi:anti-anti-sigma regulatory factor